MHFDNGTESEEMAGHIILVASYPHAAGVCTIP